MMRMLCKPVEDCGINSVRACVGALLHEEMWLQVNKLTLACLLALRNDVLVPVVILLLVQASLILQVGRLLWCDVSCVCRSRPLHRRSWRAG